MLERFLTECDVSIPEAFAQIAQEPDSPTIDDVCVAFIRKYEEFKQSVCDRKLGKNPAVLASSLFGSYENSELGAFSSTR